MLSLTCAISEYDHFRDLASPMVYLQRKCEPDSNNVVFVRFELERESDEYGRKAAGLGDQPGADGVEGHLFITPRNET
jgi:hypothetical protein